MKDGMAEEDGDESELLFLRVVLLEVPDVSGAKVVVDVGGAAELIASWDEDADTSTLIPVVLPTTLPLPLLSFDDASSTLTVLNSSRRVTSTAAIASVVSSVVLLSVGSSIPSSFGGEEAEAAEAAAAAMVFFVLLPKKKWRARTQIANPQGNVLCWRYLEPAIL